jgi:hypothetical protein
MIRRQFDDVIADTTVRKRSGTRHVKGWLLERACEKIVRQHKRAGIMFR